MPMAKPPKINVTTNYKLFSRGEDNRPLDLKRHKPLKESMEKYGFIPDYHIMCERDTKGNLVIKDGQHRFYFAQLLGLPIYWSETQTEFDVADVNTAQRGWLPMDYAQRFSADGREDYTELIEFKTEHEVPLTIAAQLLAGVTTFATIAQRFYAGDFRVTDRPWARSVVAVYAPIVKVHKKLKTRVFLLSCMAVARVKGFSAKRLVDGISHCREKIAAYATRDGYLQMLEEIYNYRRKEQIGLRIDAINVMRARNPLERKKGAGGESEAA
jgi:hypothetical protein